jgi:hypothetical protein
MTAKHFLILAACLLVLLFIFPGTSHRQIAIRSIERTRLDSAIIAIPITPQPIDLRAKLRITEHRARLDTIIDQDTLHVELDQDSTIRIHLLPAAREAMQWVHYLRRDSLIYQTERVYIERPWYESPLLVLIGTVLGFLLAVLM